MKQQNTKFTLRPGEFVVGGFPVTPDVSAPFQAFARRIAASMGISRVHLDMRLWAEEREGNSASGGRANEAGISARIEP